MPLIVPGITNKGSSSASTTTSNNTQDWMTKLMGKKLVDGPSDHASFAKKELPSNHRVIEGEGGMMTMDHKPDRLNVHVDKDGTIKNVKFG